jgi:hypothetical protein
MPAFVIPWTDLRAEPAGENMVQLTTARVPKVSIVIRAQLAQAIAMFFGKEWLEAGARPVPTEILSPEPATCEVTVSPETKSDLCHGPPSDPQLIRELRQTETARIRPDIEYIADLLGYRLCAFYILSVACLLLGVWKLLSGHETAGIFFTGAGLAVALAIWLGIRPYLVRLAVQRFDERFGPGDAERQTALQILRGYKGRFRPGRRIFGALTEASGEDLKVSPSELEKEPAPRQPETTLPPIILLDTQGQQYRIEPTRVAAFATSAVLVQRWPNCLDCVPSAGLLLCVQFLLSLLALGYAGALVLLFAQGFKPSGLPGVVFMGLYCAVLAMVGLWHSNRRTRIDRLLGEVRHRRFFRERLVCGINEIVAIQAVHVIAASRRGGLQRLEVNLIFADLSRRSVNLIPNGFLTKNPLQSTLGYARRLALFLNVPLVDQMAGMAAFVPAGMANSVRAQALSYVPGGMKGIFQSRVETPYQRPTWPIGPPTAPAPGENEDLPDIGELDLPAHAPFTSLAVEKSEDSLILRWPPRGWTARWGHDPWRRVRRAAMLFLGGAAAGFVAVSLGGPRPGMLLMLVAAGCCLTALVSFFTTCELVYRPTTLTVRGNRLYADHGHVWGVPLRQQWGRDQIAAIRMQHLGNAFAMNIYPHPQPRLLGYTLAAYRDPAELQWVAGLLRLALQVAEE